PNLAAYPELKKKFPYTQTLTLQTLSKECFLPNQEYIMWFRVFESTTGPEFALAFSFSGPNQNDFDRLPLGVKAKVSHQPNLHPTSFEGDPW
ncbi:MAG: hypothetical protein ABIP97_03600, partial [Chthoniobacterales bacterium]